MSKTIIYTNQAPDPIGPYNQAILTNKMLFISGQVAFDITTKTFILENIEMETRQVMQNISAILKESGSDFSSVVKTTIFLKDLNDYDVVNQVYGSYFDENAPARECVQVAKLPKDVNVEISVIASL